MLVYDRRVEEREYADLCGVKIGNRYLLEAQIGKGGMGVVYRALDVKTERSVALKLLLDLDPKALARFRREARAAAALRHPHIVDVLDFDMDDPSGAYIVMELVDGVTLHTLLQAEGRLPETRVVAIATQLFSALSHAHLAGILHRDVKPGNVLVSETHATPDFIRLVDFGLAKQTEPSLSEPAITAFAELVGTPAFMAPEQLHGEPLDARVDLYAAGLLLYRMLSGADPYEASGTDRLLEVIGRRRGRPLLTIAPWSTPALAMLVDECVAPDRTDRPTTAAEVLERLALLARPSVPRTAVDLTATAEDIETEEPGLPPTAAVPELRRGAVDYDDHTVEDRPRSGRLPSLAEVTEDDDETSVDLPPDHPGLAEAPAPIQLPSFAETIDLDEPIGGGARRNTAGGTVRMYVEADKGAMTVLPTHDPRALAPRAASPRAAHPVATVPRPNNTVRIRRSQGRTVLIVALALVALAITVVAAFMAAR